MSDDAWEPFGRRPADPSRDPAGPTGSTGSTGSTGPSGSGEGAGHDAVGAYALGILDDAAATAFEAHLAGCARCGERLDEFAGLEPMLALLAESPPGVPGARAVPHVPAPPPPRMLRDLVDEVVAGRARRTRRGRYLIAAAAALIIGGPLLAVTATGGDRPPARAADPRPAGPAGDAHFRDLTEKVRATDPVTGVDATIGMGPRAWGTDTVLELKNVTGPRKCRLVAVSRTGEEEVVTSWSVPKWGYGIEGSTYPGAAYPLYVRGGAAMARSDIDHFEVRTFDGKRLVRVGG
ncbi:zf-HC2 domain-containing protein [Streptomyces sp. NPDC048680]|uniref:zf-HC2 domain-containing protein n=1 Tax=Streptomyces sp. NPDC048680 TaxID=3155492 RepID=UPI00342C12CB